MKKLLILFILLEFTGEASLDSVEYLAFRRLKEVDEIASKIIPLQYISAEVRKWIFRIIRASQSGHLGGPLSSVELLTTLYFGGILRYDPQNPQHPNRDRVLIRGYMGPLRYPILALAGFFPEEWLLTYREFGSPLQGHESMFHTPGVDITPSGYLGLMLSYGTSSAYMAKYEGRPYKTYVFLGDGEEQEGNVSEAARFAAHMKDDPSGVHGTSSESMANLDEAIRLQEEIQAQLGEVDYRGFIAQAVAEAKPAGEPTRPPLKPFTLNPEPDPENNTNLMDALGDYFDKLEKQLQEQNFPFYIHSLASDSLPSFRITPQHLKPLGSFIDVDIREQHMLSMAHGMAVTNPNDKVLVFLPEAFLYRTIDQINSIAQGKSNVVILGYGAGISGGAHGPTHQPADQPGALLNMTGMTIIEPSDVYDL